MSQRTAANRRSSSSRSPAVEPVETTRRSVLGLVAEVGSEPALGLLDRPSLPAGVVGNLVGPELAEHEVLRLGVGEVEAADRCARPHRHAIGELDARHPLDVEQLPEQLLLGVVGTCWIAGCGADAGVLLLDQADAV